MFALGDMLKVLHAKLNRLLLKVVPEDEHLCRVELVALQQAGVAKQLLSYLEFLMDNCKTSRYHEVTALKALIQRRQNIAKAPEPVEDGQESQQTDTVLEPDESEEETEHLPSADGTEDDGPEVEE